MSLIIQYYDVTFVFDFVEADTDVLSVFVAWTLINFGVFTITYCKYVIFNFTCNLDLHDITRMIHDSKKRRVFHIRHCKWYISRYRKAVRDVMNSWRIGISLISIKFQKISDFEKEDISSNIEIVYFHFLSLLKWQFQYISVYCFIETTWTEKLEWLSWIPFFCEKIQKVWD